MSSKKSIYSTIIQVFLLILPNLSIAQTATFHSFVFCNTNDKILSECANSNLGRIQNLVDDICTMTGLQSDPHTIINSKFQPDVIKKEIDNCKIGKNDVVFCYINTHGENFKIKNDEFPFVQIPDSNTLVQSRKLHYYLTKKNPKILITIIESCNGYERLSKQNIFVFEQEIEQSNGEGKAVKYDDPTIQSRYRLLFSKPLNLLISAGNPGKTTKGSADGSYFTNCFINSFKEINTPNFNNKRVAWDSILKKSRLSTYQVAAGRYYPIWGFGNKEKITRVVQGNDDLSDLTDFGDEIQVTDIPPIIPREKIKIELEKVGILSPYWFNHQKYHVTVSLENSSKSSIDSVIYYLDESMPDPIIHQYNRDENFEAVPFTVSGEYLIKAKVFYSDGYSADVYENIIFPRKKDKLTK